MFNEALISQEQEVRQKLILMVPEKLLDNIAYEVLSNEIRRPNHETGGYLLGVRDDRDRKRLFLIPMATFTPKNEDEVERQGGHLNLGGPISNLYRKWQLKNWELIYPTFYKDFPFDVKNVHTKLSLLGIWHKHPGGMIQYSREDDNTIENILNTGKQDFIFPIAILENKNAGQEKSSKNVRVKFYYRAAKDRQTRILQPEIYNSQLFPNLATSPWYSQEPSIYRREISAFERLGFKAEFCFIDRSEQNGPEIWLKLSHSQLSEPIFIKTSQDFHKDRVFFIKFSDPTKTHGGGMGMILPENQETTMADIIEPMLLFRLRKSKNERAR